MPNMVVIVSQAIPPDQSPDGTLHTEYNAWTADGAYVQGTLQTDFTANAAQINAALVTAAKDKQTSLNGVVFVPADKTIIFGGAVVN